MQESTTPTTKKTTLSNALELTLKFNNYVMNSWIISSMFTPGIGTGLPYVTPPVLTAILFPWLTSKCSFNDCFNFKYNLMVPFLLQLTLRLPPIGTLAAAALLTIVARSFFKDASGNYNGGYNLLKTTFYYHLLVLLEEPAIKLPSLLSQIGITFMTLSGVGFIGTFALASLLSAAMVLNKEEFPYKEWSAHLFPTKNSTPSGKLGFFSENNQAVVNAETPVKSICTIC